MRDKFYKFFTFSGEYALYGLLFFFPISNALVESFVGLAVFGFVGRKIIKPDFKYLKFWPNILLLLFLFFSALSLFNSGYLSKSLNALFGKWMQYLGICVILQDSIIYNQKITKRAMMVFLLGASLAVLSGLSQYFLGIEFLRNKALYSIDHGAHYAMTSSFIHYNNFGAYLVAPLSLALALLLGKSSFGLKTAGLLIFSIFSTLAIILTFSRGSWLAIFIAVIFISIISRKNLKYLIPIFLAVIIMLFLLPIFQERLLRGDNSRFRFWLAAWKMINQHPFFGVGLGTFMANFPQYEKNLSASYAHNCYLQIWAESGIFSLISFVVFVSSFIYLSVKKFFLFKDFLLLGLLSGAVGFLVHSFFEVNLYSLRLAILFWVWVGLILALISQKKDK